MCQIKILQCLEKSFKKCCSPGEVELRAESAHGAHPECIPDAFVPEANGHKSEHENGQKDEDGVVPDNYLLCSFLYFFWSISFNALLKTNVSVRHRAFVPEL